VTRRTRFWIETTFACLTGALTCLTLVTREWIEAITGFDPDHGNGSLEWLIVVCFAAATALFATLALRERRRFASTG
jgi:hypothetical protein